MCFMELDLLSTAEVAALRGVGSARVLQLLEDGKLPKPYAHLALGLIWIKEDIEHFLQTGVMPTPRTTEGPTLIGTHEFRKMWGNGCRQRANKLVNSSDFPRPLKKFKSGSVWDAEEVAKWIQARRQRTGHPPTEE
jgi:predicted DNA-binding transcriptional regulator AlpA